MNTEDLRKLIDLIESQDDEEDYDDEDFEHESYSPEEEKLHDAMDIVAQFSASGIGDEELDQAFDICMEWLPDSRYTGIMYRGFGISPNVLDREDLLSEIKKEMQSYQRQVVPWSKDPEVAKRFTEEKPVGVVVQQRSTGLDPNELYYEPTDYHANGAFGSHESEVFARLDRSVSIYGFTADYIEDENDNFWPLSQVKQFLSYLKSN